ncbi:DUF2690 domain-containing protein [Arthrobacter sp. MMS24-S77]
MRKRRILGTVAAILALGFWAAPAASASEWHSGRDPIQTGCTSGSYVVASWPMVNQKYNQTQGQMQLMYSPGCQTNWINIYGNVAGNKYEASIFKGTVPGGGMHALVNNVGSDYSYMVYAPGSTCVTVGSDIADIATGVVEMNDLRTFC